MSRSISLHHNDGNPVSDYFMLIGSSSGARELGHIIGKPLPEDKSAYWVTTHDGGEVLIVASSEDEAIDILKCFFVGENGDEDYEAVGVKFGAPMKFEDLCRTDVTTGCLLVPDISCGNGSKGVYDPEGCGNCAFNSARKE